MGWNMISLSDKEKQAILYYMGANNAHIYYNKVLQWCKHHPRARFSPFNLILCWFAADNPAESFDARKGQKRASTAAQINAITDTYTYDDL